MNFGILLFTGTTYAQSGCNINAYPGSFSVEVPFSLFHDHGIDYPNINSMDFLFQSGSATGGVNFLVTSIEVCAPVPLNACISAETEATHRVFSHFQNISDPIFFLFSAVIK